MATKTSDRIQALQQRAAALARQKAAQESPPSLPDDPAHTLAATSAHFGGSFDTLHMRTVQRLPIGHIAPDLRPEMRQPRLLPLPDQLLVDGKPALDYSDLVAELRQLGASLQERQIQPIVVYPGTSDIFPSARFLILIGHRRWTAACLVGLEQIDAIIIDPPAPTDRVMIQYMENEAREEFSDMERAWALHQMKMALGDASWEVVEERLSLSRARRQQLLRLMIFTPAQQQQIARLRLQETQIRTLHTALRSGTLSSVQADTILKRLSMIMAERSAEFVQTAQSDGGLNGVAPRRQGIDGPTVARLVARASRPQHDEQESSTPRWFASLRSQLQQTSASLARSSTRVADLNDVAVEMFTNDLIHLSEQIAQIRGALEQREEE